MRKVSGSRPDGVQEEKGKKRRKGPGKYGEEKERRMELGEEENRRKDSAP